MTKVPTLGNLEAHRRSYDDDDDDDDDGSISESLVPSKKVSLSSWPPSLS